MERLFFSLLDRSIAAGWLVLAVLLLRLVFRKGPRWVFCLLWGLVALRLLCPVSIQSPFLSLIHISPVAATTSAMSISSKATR